MDYKITYCDLRIMLVERDMYAYSEVNKREEDR